MAGEFQATKGRMLWWEVLFWLWSGEQQLSLTTESVESLGATEQMRSAYM